MGAQTRVPPTYSIASVDNALQLLQLLRDNGELRVSGAAAELNVAPSTVHRLLAMLVYRGFATRDESRAYRPGPALGAEPVRAPWNNTLRDTCRPLLEQLSGEVNETTNLVFRVGSRIRFLDTVESTALVRIGARRGTILEARRASGGKAMLAEEPVQSLERLYRSSTSRGAGDFLPEREFAKLFRQLEQARIEGFARNIEETAVGVCAIGSSLRGPQGRPIAAFTIAIPSIRRKSVFDKGLINIMLETRLEIELAIAEAWDDLVDRF